MIHWLLALCFGYFKWTKNKISNSSRSHSSKSSHRSDPKSSNCLKVVSLFHCSHQHYFVEGQWFSSFPLSPTSAISISTKLSHFFSHSPCHVFWLNLWLMVVKLSLFYAQLYMQKPETEAASNLLLDSGITNMQSHTTTCCICRNVFWARSIVMCQTTPCMVVRIWTHICNHIIITNNLASERLQLEWNLSNTHELLISLIFICYIIAGGFSIHLFHAITIISSIFVRVPNFRPNCGWLPYTNPLRFTSNKRSPQRRRKKPNYLSKRNHLIEWMR